MEVVEGGKTFNIDVNMQEELLSDITLNLKKPMIGSYLVNGISIPSCSYRNEGWE